MRIERTKWQGRERVDVTASLPNNAEHLRDCLAYSAAAREGATLSGPHVGIWQGKRETAYTLSRVGAGEVWIAGAVSAALRAGCEAVQVERFGERAGSCGYTCEEWRRADD